MHRSTIMPNDNCIGSRVHDHLRKKSGCIYVSISFSSDKEAKKEFVCISNRFVIGSQSKHNSLLLRLDRSSHASCIEFLTRKPKHTFSISSFVICFMSFAVRVLIQFFFHSASLSISTSIRSVANPFSVYQHNVNEHCLHFKKNSREKKITRMLLNPSAALIAILEKINSNSYRLVCHQK